jgi:hypothetical protein
MLVAQTGAFLAGRGVDKFLLGLTAILVLVPIFGPEFFLALVRAVRGERGSVHDDDAGQNDTG